MIWRRAWALYSVAHFGKSLLWTASDLLTLYLLVSVYAVDPLIAGALFLAGLTVNALADFAVGIWLDRHPRHAAGLAVGALPLAALAFPATILMTPYGVWALLAATLTFRIAYAGCDVPHNALLTRLGDRPVRAVRLARGRTLGTALASLLAAWVASGTDRGAVAPMLWGIAAAGSLISAAMLPLLVRFRLAGGAARRDHAPWLPLPFLLASVIGIVALGALGKAVLHLPAGTQAAGGGTTILTLLILGRTASALIPIRTGAPQQGLASLAWSWIAAAMVSAGFVWNAGAAMLMLLGLAMGVTNLIGWSLLPTLASGPRGYGLYTMTSKLALGSAGLALAGGLGRTPIFTPAAFAGFALAVAAACGVAALVIRTGLTAMTARVFLSR